MTTPQDEKAFVTALVKLPEAERVKKLGEHLKSFANERPRNRATMVKGMMDAAAALTPEDRRKYAKARAAVLATMEVGTQMALVGTYREVLGELTKEQVASERETLEAIIPELKGDVKSAAERLHSYLGETRRREEASAAALHKKPWWKFWG